MKQEPIILLPFQKENLEREWQELRTKTKEIKKYFEDDKIELNEWVSNNSDLKENIFVLLSQLETVEKILNCAQEATPKKENVVQIGSVVTLEDVYTKQLMKFQVLGTPYGIEHAAYEIVTEKSPMGQALLQKERKINDAFFFETKDDINIYIIKDIKLPTKEVSNTKQK